METWLAATLKMVCLCWVIYTGLVILSAGWRAILIAAGAWTILAWLEGWL